MNQIILRFEIVYKNESIELLLDKRLSFKENFELFKDHPEIKEFQNKQIMAKRGSIVLDKNVKIAIYNLKPLTRLYIY